MKQEKMHVLKLKKLLAKGVHFEDTREFKDSIFSEVYSNAIKNVQKIVAYNREREKHQIQYVKQKAVSNVISFIGRRGTGKTSAMISFSNALSVYDGDSLAADERNLTFDSDANMKNVSFFSLDCIDASGLEESENIFILVLANMLSFLKIGEGTGSEELSMYKQRSLLQKFEKLYDDFVTLKESKQYQQDEYSSYEKLRNVSSSQKIRLNFSQLVKEYLQYVLSQKKNRIIDEAYLVISIDDLDMANYNQQDINKRHVSSKSYEIMNSIYKYLSVPGVIVLSAYNHVNLYKQCVNFFVADDLYNQDIQRESSQKLAAQFMEKIFSPIFRIYMPSWKKRDFVETQFKIDLGTQTMNMDIFKKYREVKGRSISVKDFLLILFAEITGVYYDFMGKKKHFLEPESLRFLNTMVCLVADSDGSPKNDYIAVPDEEHKQIVFSRIKKDIYYRFAQERLSNISEKQLFDQWQEQRVDRRSESIVRLICKEMQPLGPLNKKKIERFELQKKNIEHRVFTQNDIVVLDRIINSIGDNSKVEYSYAELVHCIYHMTRTGAKYSKELVACILHSYSVYLSQIYDNYRSEKRKLDRHIYINTYRDNLEKTDVHMSQVNEYYEILKNVIGDTILGRWSQYYYPALRTNTSTVGDSYDRLPVFLGYAENIRISWRFMVDDDIDKILNEIMYFSMMYTDVLNWRELPIIFVRNKNNQKIEKIEVVSDKYSNMELTGFLKYTFLYPEYLSKMEYLLKNSFEEDIEECEVISLFKRQVQAILPIYFDRLWDEYYKWDEEYGSMMIPIQNLDLVYNMIKRLFQNCEDNEIELPIHKMGKSDTFFLDEFKKMIQRFTDYLGDVDEYYCLSNENHNFKNAFNMCPYMRLLEEISTKCVEDVFDIMNAVIVYIDDRDNSLLISPDEQK